MSRKTLNWVNSPVLMEAIIRYQQNRLPRSMQLWVEQLLDLDPQKNSPLLHNNHTSNN